MAEDSASWRRLDQVVSRSRRYRQHSPRANRLRGIDLFRITVEAIWSVTALVCLHAAIGSGQPDYQRGKSENSTEAWQANDQTGISENSTETSQEASPWYVLFTCPAVLVCMGIWSGVCYICGKLCSLAERLQKRRIERIHRRKAAARSVAVFRLIDSMEAGSSGGTNDEMNKMLGLLANQEVSLKMSYVTSSSDSSALCQEWTTPLRTAWRQHNTEVMKALLLSKCVISHEEKQWLFREAIDRIMSVEASVDTKCALLCFKYCVSCDHSSAAMCHRITQLSGVLEKKCCGLDGTLISTIIERLCSVNSRPSWLAELYLCVLTGDQVKRASNRPATGTITPWLPWQQRVLRVLILRGLSQISVTSLMSLTLSTQMKARLFPALPLLLQIIPWPVMLGENADATSPSSCLQELLKSVDAVWHLSERAAKDILSLVRHDPAAFSMMCDVVIQAAEAEGRTFILTQRVPRLASTCRQVIRRSFTSSNVYVSFKELGYPYPNSLVRYVMFGDVVSLNWLTGPQPDQG